MDKDIEKIINSYGLKKYREKNLYEKIKDIYAFLVDYGYDGRDVIKITIGLPSMFCYSIDSLRRKINDMLEMGYSLDDIIKMTKVYPAIYSFSIDNMKNKIDDIMTLGFSPADIKQMTLILPAIFGYNIDGIKEKKEFYDSIGISEVMVKQPKQIMQSVELSYARYMFLHSRGIVVNMENCKKLFMDEKAFFQENGITKEELLQLYSYDEYLEKQGKVRNRIKKK